MSSNHSILGALNPFNPDLARQEDYNRLAQTTRDQYNAYNTLATQMVREEAKRCLEIGIKKTSANASIEKIENGYLLRWCGKTYFAESRTAVGEQIVVLLTQLENENGHG